MDETSKKATYFEKLEVHLREWDGMWQSVLARLAKRTSEANMEGIELLKRLETTHAEARGKLEHLRQTAEENWDSFKSEADDLLAYLSKGVGITRSRFQAWHDGAGPK
jgi:hypothetical protein